MMAADPIHVGVVYLETDYLESDQDTGGDSRGDRFLVSFSGGAPHTELRELRIRTDKDGDGISVGDPIFDTQPGGRGKSGAHSFQIVRVESQHGFEITATTEVSDGGQELVIRFDNFRAGDRFEFTIDVDEVLRNTEDLDLFNSRLDVITSGQEFQDSILEATFAAPHFESATADTIFLNDYGDPSATHGLVLPPDESSDIDSRPNRSAGAVATTKQLPKPVSLRGQVWLDNNLDGKRNASEQPLEQVELALYRLNPSSNAYEDTGHRALTSTDGQYEFSKSLGLVPGTYRITETQPAGLFSVASHTGSVDGTPAGTSVSADEIVGIEIPLGDLSAVNYDFAEAQSAGLSGWVYRDDNDNGRRDAGEPGVSEMGRSETGLAGIRVRLVPLDTIAPQQELVATTSADGSYAFTALPPGSYELIELDQPADLQDGRDAAGTINATTVGMAVNPGDKITEIQLGGGDIGVDYNFGELPLGSLTGFVYLAAAGHDCVGPHDPDRDSPLADVEVILETNAGEFIARTTTGSDGRYSFAGLHKGSYRIRQLTPAGLIDGNSHVGRIGNVQVGTSVDGGLIQEIVMTAGGDGVGYDFCEAAPAAVSGYVYHDRSNDGARASGEEGIVNVIVELVDEQGNVADTTRSDAQGRYEFVDVLPGTYAIRQAQPDGYLDGIDSPGLIDGVTVGRRGDDGDSLREIALHQGDVGREYNFGELLGASLAGRVHADLDEDCVWDPGEALLAGVMIRLLNANGETVATTTTDADGKYQFENLAPGVYSVVELTPQGFFEGSATPGSAGGTAIDASHLGAITLVSGLAAVDYNFCERPPATLAGFVFADQDGDCIADPGELGISGVVIELFNAAGERVAVTTTDDAGNYRFAGLRAGAYTIREIQPAGWLQGGQSAGSHGGDATGQDTIAAINVGWGLDLADYDFCERPAADLSGRVFADHDGDCVAGPHEPGIAGVVIELYDTAGELIANTTTDAEGTYRFDRLAAGSYTVREHQPAGWLQGGQSAGSHGGDTSVPDSISAITVGWGQSLTDYDFCEVAPSELSGHVWSDTDQDQRFANDERPLAGVLIELLGADGGVVDATRTDETGFYRFSNLPPGVYAIRETQPTSHFQGGIVVGSVGGQAVSADFIVGITLTSGTIGRDYDFPEIPPAAIAGFVFQDGATLRLNQSPLPEELREYRDGLLTDDDTPLAGIVLELRNEQGQPVDAAQTLAGDGVTGPLRAITDQAGAYKFNGLEPGIYHVYQIHPVDLLDGLDTPGSHGGIAANRADLKDDEAGQSLVDQLAAIPETDPRDDAILMISVGAGDVSTDNNFSELMFELKPIEATPIAPPPPRIVPTLQRLAPAPETFPNTELAFSSAVEAETIRRVSYADQWAVSWHLSLINGGAAAGQTIDPFALQNVSYGRPARPWDNASLNQGVWQFTDPNGPGRVARSLTLGTGDGIALVGDFNGDGYDEAAIYLVGEWFVDFNGNGRWDAADLWLRFGSQIDRPVVGDWDGDGKDDIGIFGRQWRRDPLRIRHEAGLPDPDNKLRRRLNPRQRTEFEDKPQDDDQYRLLRHRAEGQLHADAVDHVFEYGGHKDLPIAGDWNGDGIDQIAIFRDGYWLLDDGDGRPTDHDPLVHYGQSGDVPVVGDFNGDGIDELGIVRGDLWIIDTDGDRRLTANDLHFKSTPPSAASQPIAADFDGDGKAEAGYYEATQRIARRPAS